MLTFTLDGVQIELLQSAHRNLLHLVVHHEVHEGRGDVLAGRLARLLGNFILQTKSKRYFINHTVDYPKPPARTRVLLVV